ncbi:hypothetical protein BD408DRAFT_408210 [Parasitella parasitica]|nr:hypothetical protein BD408DRAFT_408210 [Parasitella parasitica]
MEKIKEKLETLKREVDSAKSRAEELQNKVETLEAESSAKDETLNSLQERAKQLEEEVDVNVANLEDTTKSFREADLQAEQLTKKAVKLEQEIAVWDKKNADMQEKYEKTKAEMDELTNL